MINNIDDFIKSGFETRESFGTGSVITGGGGGSCTHIKLKEKFMDNMYCPKCGGERKMNIKLLYSLGIPNGVTNICPSPKDAILCIKNLLVFSLWNFSCTQCDTFFTVTIYKGANGTEMAILPSCSGGVVTSNTPNAVAYYLDQAYRAKSIGANSACMAMYRGALDQLLFEQGYKEGMLGNKLKALEKDLKDDKAPKWAKDLNIKYFTYLNTLGSGSIHPNDGDIEKQKELDSELLDEIDIVFMMLLDKIYEQPMKEKGWLQMLEEKSKILSIKKY